MRTTATSCPITHLRYPYQTLLQTVAFTPTHSHPGRRPRARRPSLHIMPTASVQALPLDWRLPLGCSTYRLSPTLVLSISVHLPISPLDVQPTATSYLSQQVSNLPRHHQQHHPPKTTLPLIHTAHPAGGQEVQCGFFFWVGLKGLTFGVGELRGVEKVVFWRAETKLRGI